MGPPAGQAPGVPASHLPSQPPGGRPAPQPGGPHPPSMTAKQGPPPTNATNPKGVMNPNVPKAVGGGPKVIDATPPVEEKGNARNCCKKVLKFVFSHIGLCGMVVAYSIAGGFIFQHLEKTNELQECVKAKAKYDPLLNSTMFKLWDISASFRNDEDMEFALLEFDKQLGKFRDDVLALGYDGKNCTEMEVRGAYMWSFPGALLFSVTVITTIGYGNIAPKTYWGRLVCIAYATLGIPLMLLCLANIGDVMADIFRFVYTKVCCCGCCRRKDKNKVKAAGGQAGVKERGTPEAWKNQYAAQKNGSGAGPVVLDDDDDDDDDEEDEKISVPLTITMGVIGGYLFMGALLFGVWENWDPLKASYFCFVTISTIGFGDVVPGSANFEEADDQWKMIGAAVYMLFGMAILSMCFSLIQEEIVAKFRWVGEKIGIIEKDKSDEEEEEDETKDKAEGGDKGKEKAAGGGGMAGGRPQPAARPGMGPHAQHPAGPLVKKPLPAQPGGMKPAPTGPNGPTGPATGPNGPSGGGMAPGQPKQPTGAPTMGGVPAPQRQPPMMQPTPGGMPTPQNPGNPGQ